MSEVYGRSLEIHAWKNTFGGPLDTINAVYILYSSCFSYDVYLSIIKFIFFNYYNFTYSKCRVY